jgi:ribosomal-protein-alanine N-acetyltransferase
MSIESAFARFPSLATERLRLRQPQLPDTEALFAIKSDLEVTKHYAQEPHSSMKDTRAWIRGLRNSFEDRSAIFWCFMLKETETLVGAGGFWNFDAGFHCAEIGYELHPAHWGKGLVPEALSTILTWGFNELALHRVEANPLAGNAASIKLLEKLGFTHEGSLRQRVFFRGRFLDQLYYGLLKEEWDKLHVIAGQD